MKPGITTSLFACAAMLLSCSSSDRNKSRDCTEAVNNAKNIGLMLFEFENDYGSYPSEKTRAIVEEKSGAKLPAGNQSANALLRQLFIAEIAEREQVFYARTPGTKRADNVITPNKVLEKGENAFAYITGMSTEDNPSRPLLVCPLVPGTTRFDPEPFNGRAVILFIDNSVKVIPITKDGKVLMDGVDILSKDHPIWDGKAPDVRHPELLPVK